MKHKKGNRGNYYLKEILNVLGSEYSSDDEDILCSQTKKFNIKHICGHITQLSYKDIREHKKCSNCFYRGIRKDYYKNLVENSYNGDFEYISHEIRNDSDMFLKIKHKNCLDSKNEGF